MTHEFFSHALHKPLQGRQFTRAADLLVSVSRPQLHPSLKVAAALRPTGDWLLHADFRPGDVGALKREKVGL